MASIYLSRIIPAQAVGFLLFANGANFANSSVISRELLSKNSLDQLEKRIQWYYDDHHELPKNLTDLPIRPGYDDSICDGWEKPVIYAIQQDGSVMLTSPGEHEPDDVRSSSFTIISGDDRVINEAQTRASFEYNEMFIRDYYHAHSRLPKSLEDLPADDRDDLFRLDGWGRPVEYKVSDHTKVTLISHGVDGKQVFSSEFEVPLAKPAAAPLSIADRNKLHEAIEGDYTGHVYGVDASISVAGSTIVCTIGATRLHYNYKVMGGSGNGLVIELSLDDGWSNRRAVVEVLKNGQLQFDYTDDPHLASEWNRKVKPGTDRSGKATDK